MGEKYCSEKQKRRKPAILLSEKEYYVKELCPEVIVKVSHYANFTLHI